MENDALVYKIAETQEKKSLTNIIFFDKILLALKKCGELNIALIFSWRSTQVAEEAPLLRV